MTDPKAFRDRILAESRAARATGQIGDVFRPLKAFIAAHPADVDASMELAAMYRMLGLLESAEKIYRKILAAQPSSAALNNLAVLYSDTGRSSEAAALLQQARNLDPHNMDIHSNLISTVQYIPGITAAALYPMHTAWDAAHAVPRRQYAVAPKCGAIPSKRLRIGFVSADFSHHPVAYFMLPLFEALNPAEIAVHCFVQGIRQDHLTPRFMAVAEGWHQIEHLNDFEAAALIRKLEIDVLFDMAGHTANHRLGVFALKPAPLQISWAGYVGTTGMSAMDFVLADAHQAPVGDEAYYAEAILRMPHCYVPYLPPPNAPDVGSLPARRNHSVTFGGFHNPAKVNTETVALWAEILSAIPNARLVLKFRGIDAAANRDRILATMDAAGIESARVTLYGGSAHGELLQTYNQIDIALDPIPYSGGVTTCEALWMGVPVVTMTGGSFAGRHATSYLRTVGLDHLATIDKKQYVTTAVKLAGDLYSLEALRSTMRTRLSASPLMNYAAYARNFESAMRGAWTTYCTSRS